MRNLVFPALRGLAGALLLALAAPSALAFDREDERLFGSASAPRVVSVLLSLIHISEPTRPY